MTVTTKEAKSQFILKLHHSLGNQKEALINFDVLADRLAMGNDLLEQTLYEFDFKINNDNKVIINKNKCRLHLRELGVIK